MCLSSIHLVLRLVLLCLLQAHNVMGCLRCGCTLASWWHTIAPLLGLCRCRQPTTKGAQSPQSARIETGMCPVKTRYGYVRVAACQLALPCLWRWHPAGPGTPGAWICMQSSCQWPFKMPLGVCAYMHMHAHARTGACAGPWGPGRRHCRKCGMFMYTLTSYLVIGTS